MFRVHVSQDEYHQIIDDWCDDGTSLALWFKQDEDVHGFEQRFSKAKIYKVTRFWIREQLSVNCSDVLFGDVFPTFNEFHTDYFPDYWCKPLVRSWKYVPKQYIRAINA